LQGTGIREQEAESGFVVSRPSVAAAIEGWGTEGLRRE
jgi:hypothetical protein